MLYIIYIRYIEYIYIYVIYICTHVDICLLYLNALYLSLFLSVGVGWGLFFLAFKEGSEEAEMHHSEKTTSGPVDTAESKKESIS